MFKGWDNWYNWMSLHAGRNGGSMYNCVNIFSAIQAVLWLE